MKEYKDYKLVLKENSYGFKILHQTDLFLSGDICRQFAFQKNKIQVQSIRSPLLSAWYTEDRNLNQFSIEHIRCTIYLRGSEKADDDRLLQLNGIYHVKSDLVQHTVRDYIINNLKVWAKKAKEFKDWKTEYKQVDNIHYF